MIFLSNFTRITSIFSPISVARNNLDLWIKNYVCISGVFFRKKIEISRNDDETCFQELPIKFGRWRILFFPILCSASKFVHALSVYSAVFLRKLHFEMQILNACDYRSSVFSCLLSIFLSVTYHCVSVCCFCYFTFTALCSYCSCDDFHCMAVRHGSQLKMKFLIRRNMRHFSGIFRDQNLIHSN